MESTALYWKPVWGALERYWQPICQKREGAVPTSGILHRAQAQSNRGPRGRKKDFGDAERLVKRLVADELKLSFVPDREQRPHPNPPQIPAHTCPGPVTEPVGGFAGRGPPQVIQPSLGSVGY